MSRFVLTLLVFVCFFIQIHAQVNVGDSPPDSAVLQIPSLKAGKDGLKSVVDYHADDSVRLLVKERKVFLYGNAVVKYEDMKLEAGFIEVNFETNDIHAMGVPDSTGKIVSKPILTTEGTPYNAEEMWYNFKTKKGISTGVITELEQGEGIVRGEKFLKDSSGNMYVRHATYTTCNAEHPHFWIAASKFKVIPNKQAISGPANLVIAGINTPLVLPFGFFPMQKQRSKGIVIGQAGSQDAQGFFLRDFGYYLPINDYLDLKATGDFYFRGSWGLGLSTNYKKLYKYNGSFLFKFNKFLIGERESPTFTNQNEYRVEWHYNRDGKAKPGRTLSANVTYITRNQQKFTSQNINDIVATTSNSSVSYGRSFFKNNLNMSLSAIVNQNLTTGDMNVDLPNLNLNLNRQQPFKNIPGSPNKLMIVRNLGITYNGSLKNNVKVNQDSIFEVNNRVVRFKDDFKNGLKNGFQQGVNLGTSFKAFKYFTFAPNFSYSEYWYLKTIQKTWTGDSLVESDVNGFSRVGGYSTSLSFNTTVYGYQGFKKGKIIGIRHVIRPGISANYSPNYYEDVNYGYRRTQLTDSTFGFYSIYDKTIFGGPSGRENGSLNFNIGNNLEMKIHSRDTADGGIKKLSLIDNLGISGGYNFLADSLQMSNLSITGITTLFNIFRINGGATIDPYNFAPDTNGVNRKIDKFMLKDGKLGRLTFMRLSVGTSLKPNMFKPKGKEESVASLSPGLQYLKDFSVPWDLSMNYSYTINKQFDDKPRIDQTISYNGSLKLTDYWRIGFSSGYNFVSKQTAISSIDFARDLHCWEFNFHWVPTGIYKQFNFELKVKASTLKDLKIRRQESWLDNTN